MLTKEQIEFLNDVCPNVWTENNDIINVNGNVIISNTNLTEIPVQFGQINGYFNCSYNKLTTLKRAPSIVEGYFNSESNQLPSLEGGPKKVNGYYSCSTNLLSNLIGAPEICNGTFFCSSNQLTSLEGCPHLIKKSLFCSDNQHLEYLWGIARVIREVYYTNHNEINEWVIECARRNIIFPYFTLEENINWIKREQKYSCLLGATKEIRQHFPPRILHLVDMGSYNESKILDFKKFIYNNYV